MNDKDSILARVRDLHSSIADLQRETRQLEEALQRQPEENLISPEYVTARSFMQAVGISRATLYRWQQEGRLQVISLGRGKRFVKRSELLRLLREAGRQ